MPVSAPSSSRPSANRARPLAVAALVLASVLVTLGLIEIGVRVFDAMAGKPADTLKALHRRTPAGKRILPNLDVVIDDHQTSHRRVHVRTNQFGLRGPDVPARADRELRILVLGDSITFADYVDEAETYPARLERDLQARLPNRVVRVLNAGGPNVGTMDEAGLLDELAAPLRPDLVLVGFYMNDAVGQAPYPSRIAVPAGLGWSRLAERAATTYARLVHEAQVRPRYVWVHDFAARAWVRERAAYDALVQKASGDWGAAWQEDSWGPVEAALRHMQAVGNAQGFRIAVAAFPVSVQVESDHEDDRPQRRIRALAGRLDMPFVDVLPALRAARGRPLFYDQCHLTPEGNALAAGVIAEMIRALPVASASR